MLTILDMQLSALEKKWKKLLKKITFVTSSLILFILSFDILTENRFWVNIGEEKMKIAAHKVIVFNRCPKLREYEKEGEIFFGDVSLPALSHLLLYLYSDTTPTQELEKDQFVELLNLSIKLELTRLKSICEWHRNLLVLGDQEVAIEKSRFHVDFEKCVDNQEFSDITFQLENGDKVNAHRIILVTRSEYFKAGLLGYLSEKESRVFHLKGEFSKASLIHCLSFMYTGVSPVAKEKLHPDTVIEIIQMAHLFNLHDLVETLGFWLADFADSESAAFLFQVGDLYNCESLKKGVKQFVMTHVKSVKESESFSLLSEEQKEEIQNF